MQTTPPKYNLSNFQIPTVLYYAGNDWLADLVDVKHLIDSLERSSIIESANFIPEWMHLDFIWGINAPNEVYYGLIKDALADSL